MSNWQDVQRKAAESFRKQHGIPEPKQARKAFVLDATGQPIVAPMTPQELRAWLRLSARAT